MSRHLRAALLFVLVFAAAIGTAFLRGTGVLAIGPEAVTSVLSLISGAGIAALLLWAVFRIVVSPIIPTSHLLPAAVLAGVAWELLQRLGTWIVMDRLAEAQDLYGTIGFVVVTLFWINLLARTAVFANEFAVVQQRRLWPRRIAQPPLTEADRRVLEGLVNNERRRPEQTIDVHFDESADDDRDGQPTVHHHASLPSDAPGEPRSNEDANR